MGPDKRHAEGPAAVQGLLHLGHDFQGLFVGRQQQLEMVVALFEFGLDLFFAEIRGRFRAGIGKKLRQYAFDFFEHAAPA